MDEEDSTSDSMDEISWMHYKALLESQIETAAIKIDTEKLVKSLYISLKNVFNKKFSSNMEDILKLNVFLSEQRQDFLKLFKVQLARIRRRRKLNLMLLRASSKRTHKRVSIQGAVLTGAKLYLGGNMFFKNLSGYGAPNNADYIQRKKEGEIFPMDFGLVSRHNWTENDKKSLVFGIKEQLVNTLIERRAINVRWENKRNYLNSVKLIDLLKKVDGNFTIDWLQISAADLKSRHNETSCEAIWKVFLQPSLKHGKWSKEENNSLIAAVMKYNFQNWQAIGKEVGGRSEYQCFVQYKTYVCNNLPKRLKKWDKTDDAKLIELVNKNKFNNVIDWTIVTSYFRFKPRGDVIARYNTRLKPHINHDPFSPEEDLLLIGLVRKYGEKFNTMPRHMFPDRTILQLRNRYLNTLKHRHRNTTWSYEDDMKLTDFVSEHGTSSWLQCAEVLGNHTRTSCRTRYLTIQKFFAKNSKSNLKDVPRHRVLKSDNMIRTDMFQTQVKLIETAQSDKLKYQSLQTKKTKKTFVKSIKEEKQKELKDTLRSLEFEMQKTFTFGYDYSVLNAYCTKWPTSISAKNFLATILYVQVPVKTDILLLTQVPAPVQEIAKQNMKIQNKDLQYLLFNYPALMGYKAMCVFRSVPNIKNKTKIYNCADLTILRNRLMLIFYGVGCICTMHPSKLKEKQYFLTDEDSPFENYKKKFIFCERYFVMPTDIDEPNEMSNAVINTQDCSSFPASTEEPLLKKRKCTYKSDSSNESVTMSSAPESFDIPSYSLQLPGTSANSLGQIGINTLNRYAELDYIDFNVEIAEEDHLVSES